MHPSTFVASAIALACHATAQNTSSASGSTATSGGVAGLVSGLSSSCQAAAGSLLSSDFGSCANIIGLVSVIGAQGSVVPALNTWIGGVCSSNACSDSTVSTAQSNVNTGCADDVSKGTASAVSLTTIVNNYKSIRNLICTQYTSNGTYCVPSVLGNVQSAGSKNISVSDVEGLLTQGPAALATMLAAVPSSTYCVDCGKAIFVEASAIKVNGTTTNANSASGALAAKCGASFTDGQLPSSVRIAGSGAASSAKNSGAIHQAPCYALVVLLFSIAGFTMV